MQILRSISVGWLTAILWLASVVLAIVEIVVVRDTVLDIYARLMERTGLRMEGSGTPYWSAVTLGNVIVLLLGIVVMAFAVGSGEYHYRRAGTRGSWRLFAWTFGVEAAILVLGFFT